MKGSMKGGRCERGEVNEGVGGGPGEKGRLRG
jgi:hypothetical protein